MGFTSVTTNTGFTSVTTDIGFHIVEVQYILSENQFIRMLYIKKFKYVTLFYSLVRSLFRQTYVIYHKVWSHS